MRRKAPRPAAKIPPTVEAIVPTVFGQDHDDWEKNVGSPPGWTADFVAWQSTHPDASLDDWFRERYAAWYRDHLEPFLRNLDERFRALIGALDADCESDATQKVMALCNELTAKTDNSGQFVEQDARKLLPPRWDSDWLQEEEISLHSGERLRQLAHPDLQLLNSRQCKQLVAVFRSLIAFAAEAGDGEFRIRAAELGRAIVGYLRLRGITVKRAAKADTSSEQQPVDVLKEPGRHRGKHITPLELESAQYLFRDCGGCYEICFEGETGMTRGKPLGAKYAFELVQKPYHQFRADRLRNIVAKQGGVSEDEAIEQYEIGDTRQERDSRGNAVDSEAESERRNLEAQLQTLLDLMEEDLASGGAGRAENLADELQRAKEHIQKTRLRRGGRIETEGGPGSRKVRILGRLKSVHTDATEKARQAIWKALDSFYRKCSQEWGLPRFAAHLEPNIERRTTVSYRPPAPAPNWQIP